MKIYLQVHIVREERISRCTLSQLDACIFSSTFCLFTYKKSESSERWLHDFAASFSLPGVLLVS